MQTKVVPFKDSEESKTAQVEQMFDEIAPKYDYLNHLLSMGIDKSWRKKAIQMIAVKNPKNILDVATGTGDFAIDALRILPDAKIVGVDISNGMLDVGRQKLQKLGLTERISLEREDSQNLGYDEGVFDAVICAFGVRNFDHLEKGLAEMYRVTRDGGMVSILEFSRPRHFPIKQFYHFYFRYILPRIGGWVSKSKRAYTYLPESVSVFPDGKDMLDILQKIGYKNTKCTPVTFGIASIYTAEK